MTWLFEAPFFHFSVSEKEKNSKDFYVIAFKNFEKKKKVAAHRLSVIHRLFCHTGLDNKSNWKFKLNFTQIWE